MSKVITVLNTLKVQVRPLTDSHIISSSRIIRCILMAALSRDLGQKLSRTWKKFELPQYEFTWKKWIFKQSAAPTLAGACWDYKMIKLYFHINGIDSELQLGPAQDIFSLKLNYCKQVFFFLIHLFAWEILLIKKL